MTLDTHVIKNKHIKGAGFFKKASGIGLIGIGLIGGASLFGDKAVEAVLGSVPLIAGGTGLLVSDIKKDKK